MNTSAHAATTAHKSKMIWVVSCTCGQSYTIRQQATHASVEAHASACAEAINSGRYQCAS